MIRFGTTWHNIHSSIQQKKHVAWDRGTCHFNRCSTPLHHLLNAAKARSNQGKGCGIEAKATAANMQHLPGFQGSPQKNPSHKYPQKKNMLTKSAACHFYIHNLIIYVVQKQANMHIHWSKQEAIWSEDLPAAPPHQNSTILQSATSFSVKLCYMTDTFLVKT